MPIQSKSASQLTTVALDSTEMMSQMQGAQTSVNPDTDITSYELLLRARNFVCAVQRDILDVLSTETYERIANHQFKTSKLPGLLPFLAALAPACNPSGSASSAAFAPDASNWGKWHRQCTIKDLNDLRAITSYLGYYWSEGAFFSDCEATVAIAPCNDPPTDTTLHADVVPLRLPLKALIVTPKLLTIAMMVWDVIVVFTNCPIEGHADPLQRAKDNCVIGRP